MNETQPNQDNTSMGAERTNDQLGEIQNSIDGLKEDSRRRRRDKWDIAGIVAQILSGVIIAVVALVINARINSAQQRVAERLQVSNYLKIIVDAHQDSGQRAAAIALLDIAAPNHAVRVASHYARTDPSQPVREQAIRLLGKFASGDGRAVLAQIAAGSMFPDKHLAAMAMGQQVKELLARISDIDDIGRLSVNGKLIHEIPFCNDSGWVNLTPTLKTGENRIEFLVINGKAGGWSGRLQITAGEHQYDSTTLAKYACPCDAPAFKIEVLIVVGSDGTIRSVSPKIPFYL